jgi:signal transduction histidine kinase
MLVWGRGGLATRLVAAEKMTNRHDAMVTSTIDNGRERGPIGTVVRARRLAARHLGEPLDAALVGAVVVLTLGAAASLVVPGLQMRVVAPALDLVLDSVTALVTLSVAALGWVRYRQSGEPVALFQSAAFLVLAIANGRTLVLATSGLDARTGMALSAPGQGPLYAFTFAHLLAAALLVAGSIDALRHRRPRWPLFTLTGSAIATLLLIALVETGAGSLPPLGSVAAATSSAQASAFGGAMPSLTLVGAAAQVVISALFLWAAALSRRLYRRDRSIGDGYLSVGLVVAAFAQVATAVYPGTYAGLISSGDLLRLGFDVILLLGIQNETGAALARLRLANADLARLQAVELERTALAERARFSRELHDGLAQDLWLAKLKAGRLAALSDLGPEATALTAELSEAIDAGLAEARQAVATMRLSGEPSGTLHELLSRSVDEFADRFGVRAEFECASDLPPLSPRAQAEALRIVHEALTNVRRHADATVVRVRAFVEAGRLVVAVGDNGRGFEPDAVVQPAFGLASMQERAALIGGELSIESAPQDGTRVSLVVPLVPVVAALGVGAL